MAMVPPRLRPDLVFVGSVPQADLPSYYASADLFCAPSLGGESFGIVLAEAMAVGLPVVCSDIGGYRDVVRDGADGLLVPPRDPEALAAAIAGLLDNPARLAAMGEAAATARRYAWPVVAGEVAEVYEAALAGLILRPIPFGTLRRRSGESRRRRGRGGGPVGRDHRGDRGGDGVRRVPRVAADPAGPAPVRGRPAGPGPQQHGLHLRGDRAGRGRRPAGAGLPPGVQGDRVGHLRRLGALLGLAQGVLAVLLLPVLGMLNRNVRAGDEPRPGQFGRAYGSLTPVALLVASVVFGTWVGIVLIP